MMYPYKNLENFTLPSLFDRSIELYKDEDASLVTQKERHQSD